MSRPATAQSVGSAVAALSLLTCLTGCRDDSATAGSTTIVVAASVNSVPAGPVITGSAATEPPAVVELEDFMFAPSPIVVDQGSVLTLHNDGYNTHNFHVEDQSIESADVAPGDEVEVDLSSLAPGEYVVFCSIAGHRDSGMESTLEVRAAS